MTPAFTALADALGEYVCFLSDDNAYLPGHLAPLVATLDADPRLGFVYSSCHYAGRTVLRLSPPRGAKIDLGQPLFRTRVLREAMSGWARPHEFAWDWRLISRMLEHGADWRHIDKLTFVFRLAAYPQFVKALA